VAVHQLLPVFSPGDAIGQAVRRMRAVLRGFGIGGDIYAQLTHQSLQREARPAVELTEHVQPGDIVLYHLSIGASVATLFARLPCRRVLVYHNITPARYFQEVNPRVAYWLERGRRELAWLSPLVELGLADSAYNAAELTAAGCPAVLVVPLPVDLARLRPRSAQPTEPPRLICVSRLAPNKRQHELVRVLAALRYGGHREATLVMPGGWDDSEGYVAGLRRFAARLGVQGAVEMPGHVSDRELGDLYASSTAALSASEHEGFGAPLVEAMAFDLPVVARAAAAVPETLGDAGLLLGSDDPLVWAAVVDRVIRDGGLRRLLIERGRRRLTAFSGASLETGLQQMAQRLRLDVA
jgi:glycosyltransferase involved in cell wall biosynthesis